MIVTPVGLYIRCFFFVVGFIFFGRPTLAMLLVNDVVVSNEIALTGRGSNVNPDPCVPICLIRAISSVYFLLRRAVLSA